MKRDKKNQENKPAEEYDIRLAALMFHFVAFCGALLIIYLEYNEQSHSDIKHIGDNLDFDAL